jgi:hypothetical protein
VNPRERAASNAKRNLERAESHLAHLNYCVEWATQEVEHCRREVDRLEAAVLRQARAQA